MCLQKKKKKKQFYAQLRRILESLKVKAKGVRKFYCECSELLNFLVRAKYHTNKVKFNEFLLNKIPKLVFYYRVASGCIAFRNASTRNILVHESIYKAAFLIPHQSKSESANRYVFLLNTLYSLVN